jgi:ankyrin repeat protein
MNLEKCMNLENTYNMYEFIDNNNLNKLKDLIEKGYNKFEKKDGVPILIYAIKKDKYNVVKYLIYKKVGINDDDNYGNTALHYLTLKNSMMYIKYIIEYGKADIFKVNNYGNTPFSYCINSDKIELILYFLSLGCSPKTYVYNDIILI